MRFLPEIKCINKRCLGLLFRLVAISGLNFIYLGIIIIIRYGGLMGRLDMHIMQWAKIYWIFSQIDQNTSFDAPVVFIIFIFELNNMYLLMYGIFLWPKLIQIWPRQRWIPGFGGYETHDGDIGSSTNSFEFEEND